MEVKKEAWQQIVFVCPECGKEFEPESLGFHVRLCPQCSGQRAVKESVHWEPLERAAVDLAS